MELVIKISDELYDNIRFIKRLAPVRCREVGHAILDGTPLPKGHGKLIDASEKVTIQTYDDEYEVISEKTMTIEDFLTVYGDGGYTTIIEADNAKSEEV